MWFQGQYIETFETIPAILVAKEPDKRFGCPIVNRQIHTRKRPNTRLYKMVILLLLLLYMYINTVMQVSAYDYMQTGNTVVITSPILTPLPQLTPNYNSTLQHIYRITTASHHCNKAYMKVSRIGQSSSPTPSSVYVPPLPSRERHHKLLGDVQW